MNNEHEKAIIVKSVSKSFRLPHEQHSGLKQFFVNVFKRNNGYEVQQVLSDINFEVSKGEFFGIVGRNGSGKSTLLKVLASIYSADQGAIAVNGSLTPFIELGVGFNPELTGRENVYLNGALLGFSNEEMDTMYDEIVEFAELERFMDQKLKNYSSGMQVRLAFSIAIQAKSEILIMDEVLAVGDAEFQKKCFDTFRRLKKEGRTIILVTHDMGNVERFCDRVLILNNGKVLDLTSPRQASEIYARLNIKESSGDSRKSNKDRLGSGEVRVINVALKANKKDSKVFRTNDNLRAEFTLEAIRSYKDKKLTIGLAFRNEDGVPVFGPNSGDYQIKSDAILVTMEIDRLSLRPGVYTMTVVVFERESMDQLDVLNDWVQFSVVSDHMIGGLVDVESRWSAK